MFIRDLMLLICEVWYKTEIPTTAQSCLSAIEVDLVLVFGTY